MAQGFFGVVVIAGPAIGPTLGGYLTTNVDWRWIFFINVPSASRRLHVPDLPAGGRERANAHRRRSTGWGSASSPRASARSRPCSKRARTTTGGNAPLSLFTGSFVLLCSRAPRKARSPARFPSLHAAIWNLCRLRARSSPRGAIAHCRCPGGDDPGLLQLSGYTLPAESRLDPIPQRRNRRSRHPVPRSTLPRPRSRPVAADRSG